MYTELSYQTGEESVQEETIPLTSRVSAELQSKPVSQ